MEFLNKIIVQKGDITKLQVDAIVNAANCTLLGGAGVDGCIHRAAGEDLLEECETLGGCKTGQSKITKGYKLPAKHVIHTVGPIGEHPEELSSCYKTSMDLMKENNLKSIAFCCISTGIYGYPNDKAAKVAFQTVFEWLQSNPDVVDQVIFCCFMPIDMQLYTDLMAEYEENFEVEKSEEAQTTEESSAVEKEEAVSSQETDKKD